MPPLMPPIDDDEEVNFCGYKLNERFTVVAKCMQCRRLHQCGGIIAQRAGELIPMLTEIGNKPVGKDVEPKWFCECGNHFVDFDTDDFKRVVVQ